MTTFAFNNETLSVLQAAFYEKDWNGVSAAHLLDCVDAMGGSEQLSQIVQGLNSFISAASNGIDGMPGDGLEEAVLLVKANAGLFESVTGPRILASEDGEGLILKFGDNKLPVLQQGMTLAVGKLKGDLIIAEKGQEGDKYLAVDCDFREPGSRDIYSVPVRTVKEIEDDSQLDENGNPAKIALTKGDLLFFLEDGRPLVEFCQLDKSGGFTKMQELGLGKFLVAGIDCKDMEWEGKKFKSYTLTLADGRRVGARGGSEKIAKMGVKIDPTKPWMLMISKIEEKGGKWYVDNVLIPPAVAALQAEQEKKSLAPASTKAPARKGKAPAKTAAPGMTTVEATVTPLATMPPDDAQAPW